MKKFLTFISFLIISCEVFSQDTVLTIQQAIETALKNNYDIKIIANVSEQAKNNNTPGNAGMLPDIDANGSYTRSSNSLNQKYNNGLEVDREAAVSTNAIADLGANWTIFDGMKMFHTKNKFSELSMQSRDQLKIQIENSLQEVISSYYAIVRHQQLLKSMREELLFSDERVKISDRKRVNGSGSKLDWLQAKTEYNRQRALEISLESEAAAAKINLNRLLGRNPETNFSIEDTVIITYKPVFEEVKKTVNEQSNTLNYYRRNQRIALLTQRENQALRWPELNINAHYIYSKNTSEAGFTLFNQVQGFNYGVTATIPIFHGFNINRQIKNSKLDVLNADINFESVSSSINSDLLNAWREFSNNLELLQIEEQNIGYAREVLSISQERYRVGLSNVLEQREAQRIFEEAMTRLADARYNAKISETTLRRLNGELVKLAN